MTHSRGYVIWLYGLPGAGKTTQAATIAAQWRAEGKCAVILDGDDVRQGLSADLGFNEVDRSENIRRTAQVAALLCRQGVFVVAALVTPLRKHRDLVQRLLHGCPHELRWLDCPPDICAERRAVRDGNTGLDLSDCVFEAPL